MAESIIFGPWSGGIKSSTASVKVAVQANAKARLVYSSAKNANGDLISPTSLTPDVISASEMDVVTFNLKDLDPDTTYHYMVEINDALVREKEGRFKTFPPENHQASFKFVCA